MILKGHPMLSTSNNTCTSNESMVHAQNQTPHSLLHPEAQTRRRIYQTLRLERSATNWHDIPCGREYRWYVVIGIITK